MSHIVTIATEIRDAEALRLGCRRIGVAEPHRETVKLFTGEATGHAVKLPDWRYPVVCHLESGKVEFDNFNGRWGEQRHLDRLLQMYAVERTRLEARKQGHSVTEQPLADGAIKLTVQVGGEI